jgi:UDP-glucose 4-epimerase
MQASAHSNVIGVGVQMLLEDLEAPDGCSVDEYATALEKVIATKLQRYVQLQKRLGDLKTFLANEEALSARVQHVPMY